MNLSADIGSMMGLALGFLVIVALIGAFLHSQ